MSRIHGGLSTHNRATSAPIPHTPNSAGTAKVALSNRLRRMGVPLEIETIVDTSRLVAA